MKRRLKIYSQSMGGGNYTQVPALLLKGKWMEEAGFRFGDYVEVDIEDEVITIKKTTPPEAVKKKTLQEKIDGLSPEQKEKLSRLIDKL
jgi:antitoxin component of MazEF toxin-antitoxin module